MSALGKKSLPFTRQKRHTLVSAITPGQFKQLLEPPTGVLTPWHAFRVKLLLIGSHVQRTKMPLPLFWHQCTRLTLASSVYPEWGLACQDIGSLLYTTRSHDKSHHRTASKTPRWSAIQVLTLEEKDNMTINFSYDNDKYIYKNIYLFVLYRAIIDEWTKIISSKQKRRKRHLVVTL